MDDSLPQPHKTSRGPLYPWWYAEGLAPSCVGLVKVSMAAGSVSIASLCPKGCVSCHSSLFCCPPILSRFFHSCVCVCVMMCLWVHEPLHVCGSQRTTWGTWFFPTFLWFLGIKLSSPGLYSKYLPAKSPCYPLTPAFPLSTPSSSAVPSGGGDRDVFCRREHSTEALLLVLWPVMSLCMNHLGAHSKSLCGIFCRSVK